MQLRPLKVSSKANRRVSNTQTTASSALSEAILREESPSEEQSQLWHTSQRPPSSNPDVGLRRLLENDTLIIERRIEKLNIFVGFEQSNRYSISSEAGVPMGYIAEESKGLFGVMARQAFATHRPFRAVIVDVDSTPILWLRRPFAWINSRMYVQCLKEYSADAEPVLDTFGEVRQGWHPWRRRYDLFLRWANLPNLIVLESAILSHFSSEGHRRILSTTSEPQPEPAPSTFSQFAKVDMGFLAWHFRLHDGRGDEVAY